MSANAVECTGNRDGLLRLTMRADAAISGFFGMAGLAGWIPEFSGATKAFGYGADSFFVAYGFIVWRLAGVRSVRRAGIGVVVANLVYTAAAVVLVLGQILALTDSGVTFAIVSAVYTLVFAGLQYVGSLRIKSSR
ncbi:hypothetical protein AWC05_13665 [Mycobacterium florentinum]|uniref:Uncharacterized protein n=1 Tax=Mycobacterium florentinum TaxID=292462 RepID=A0A1X1UDQ9_MYCFL|nr:hypothetical protein [Mycobacterium florentinum]MCV7412098.1 hypothetical protein [Mycobacterium florentinum]ORV54926.1 hypothetical protein AWC05_13665 [Mycobacterium florentinum]BBX81473.1 hypothetical protein MFLOJ_52600 [Mycobacterium florentinum]